MTLRLNLDLENMTYGELFDFADTARGAGKERTALVDQVPVINDEERISHFAVEVSDISRASRPVTFDPDTASYYETILTSVLTKDGDARAEMLGLQELRDALR